MSMKHPARAPSEILTELLVGYSRGERSAFSPLFELVWPLIVRRCRHLDDPEDAAQEVLLKVFSRIADYDCQRDGITWILAITRYEVLTALRRKKRSREDKIGDLSWAPSREKNAEDAALRKEMQNLLSEAMDTLSDQDRALIFEQSRDDGASAHAQDARTRKRKQRAIEKLQLACRRLW
jgi:RNA polymerase sigma factor (sigma-70 family)